MASRPIWRGHLRLALVSCPVALFNARHDRGAIKFNLINPETGNRIRMVSLDAETGGEVAHRDTVKGYEFQKNRFLLMTDEDFDSVKVESSSTMKVEKFVDADSIDPIFYDASYYVAPDGRSADDVYTVLREAIVKTGKVALTRLVISQRERTVTLRPVEGGSVAHTLNEERDLNSSSALFEDIQRVQVDPEMLALAVQLVDRKTGKYDPADLEDRYETRLRAMIEAKLKGEGVNLVEEQTTAPSNVIDLMAALKNSLREVPQPYITAEAAAPKATKKAKKTPTPEEIRRQPAFKLPIEGGQKGSARTDKLFEAKPEPVARTRRKAQWRGQQHG